MAQSEDDYVTLNFRIEYDTKQNELAIIGSLSEFGNWEKDRFLKLTWSRGNVWRVRVKIPIISEFELEYKYVEVNNGKIVRWEDTQHKVRVDGSFKGHNILFMDRWLLCSPYDSINESSAFKVIRKRDKRNKAPSRILPYPSDDKICFKMNLKHFNLKGCETIYVSGSDVSLGRWNLENALRMTDHSFPNLQASFTMLKDHKKSVEYKLIKGPRCVLTKENAVWDILPNKVICLEEESPDLSCIMINCAPFMGDKNWRGAGVAVPMFSLRSEDSMGVGEFPDLKLLVKFAKKVGMTLIQTLPVNDTNTAGNWKDNYPYSPLSVFALHPIYVRIQQIEGVSKDVLLKVENLKSELNSKFVDYEKTLKNKLELLHEIFVDQKELFLKDESFREWFLSNKEWLVPYAVFCALRDKNGTSDYNTWGKYANVSREQITELSDESSEIYDKVAENYFIQYHASRQLREASEYASSNGVAFKGDLPIGVDLYSCDVWMNRNLFITNLSMGGPPDPVNDFGENWGFPIYNWDEMEKDDYAWWRNRLRVLSNYFHAIRIDHVLGFFRAWCIPRTNINSFMGMFNPMIPMSAKEFEERGIWDFDRLSHSYTSWDEMKSHFTESKCHQLVRDYFDEVSFLRYTFKKDFEGEKDLIKKIDKNEEDNDVRLFLLKTFVNRVLIEDPVLSRHYHFRIFMQKTSSFQDLDCGWKKQLDEMYHEYFGVRQDKFWRDNSMKTLPMMQNTTDMLVCAENIGTIPECTQSVLDDLSILGLRIQRWPKKSGEKLENPLNHSYFNVCSPSIHDSSTIRGWWEEDRTCAKLLGEMIGLDGNFPIECQPDIIEKILGLHFASPAILVIIAIQDLFALDDELRISDPLEERVNVPADPFPSWRYRIPVTLEKLLSCEEWMDKIHNLVKNTGRD